VLFVQQHVEAVGQPVLGERNVHKRPDKRVLTGRR
jgi:hypothetical protein